MKYCKKCWAEKSRKYREENKEKRKVSNAAWYKRSKEGSVRKKKTGNDANYQYKRDLLNTIKRNSGCVFCGESEPVCLDFHHTNPNEKDFEVSKIDRHTVQELLNEAQKCIIVCSNCHRKIHMGIINL